MIVDQHGPYVKDYSVTSFFLYIFASFENRQYKEIDSASRTPRIATGPKSVHEG